MKQYLLIFVAAAAPLLAHHSFAAEFDNKKPVELKGTLVELEWVNPHAWIHMEVTDASGKVAKWDCELGSPNLLMRNGWRRDSLKKGDVIIIPAGVKHRFTNPGRTPAVTFNVYAPPAYPAGTKG